jgi:2-polyprenyl-3-methyl-5-hydroxy-6-metoxy-1,4-benzoquinol methylase
MAKAFDFGENWRAYSSNALTRERFAQARRDFSSLLAPAYPLHGKTFLDIGFGQGLAMISAGLDGARVYGVDINPLCREVFLANSAALCDSSLPEPTIQVGSILDPTVVANTRAWAPAGFDIVHSWGALHHTGDMWTAIDNAAALVKPGGLLVLAIYNRHWSSPLWTPIKRTYVNSPRIVQKAMNLAFTPIIFSAKLLVTRRNPLAKERGMEFYYDVIDWVGGYPYEYASAAELTAFVEEKGFVLETLIPANVPTGCNEFTFRRTR